MVRNPVRCLVHQTLCVALWSCHWDVVESATDVLLEARNPLRCLAHPTCCVALAVQVDCLIEPECCVVLVEVVGSMVVYVVSCFVFRMVLIRIVMVVVLVDRRYIRPVLDLVRSLFVHRLLG